MGGGDLGDLRVYGILGGGFWVLKGGGWIWGGFEGRFGEGGGIWGNWGGDLGSAPTWGLARQWKMRMKSP